MTEKLTSILEVPMRCVICGWIGTLKDCEPDIDGDGRMGCPVADCGGLAIEEEKPQKETS